MIIDLPERLRPYIAAKIAAGQFADETAVITYIVERWAEWEAQAADFRTQVRHGIEAADAERGTSVESADEAAALATIIRERGRELRNDAERDAPTSK